MNLKMYEEYDLYYFNDPESKSFYRVAVIGESTTFYYANLFYKGLYQGEVNIDKDDLQVSDQGIMTGLYIKKQLELPIGKAVCDCGGYKVYNNFSSEFHSAWCSLRK